MRIARISKGSPPAPDSGYSLTEVVVALALIGIAIVPIMMAGIVTIKASSSSRTAARVETVLANAADRVNRAGESCSYDVYVEAAALAEGWSASQATATYSYYVPAASPVTLGTWVEGACPGATRPEGLVQRVIITVTGPNGHPQRTIEMVKSDV
ncbi:MAG: prepilin-type N-terminal cleavage/methylation domain-containing protein [Actinobacteria bacterium]|nr:prepilin-type N-terminal cleavage/methylation domain-containing protein [Actinomycetota bacterium]